MVAGLILLAIVCIVFVPKAKTIGKAALLIMALVLLIVAAVTTVNIHVVSIDPYHDMEMIESRTGIMGFVDKVRSFFEQNSWRIL